MSDTNVKKIKNSNYSGAHTEKSVDRIRRENTMTSAIRAGHINRDLAKAIGVVPFFAVPGVRQFQEFQTPENPMSPWDQYYWRHNKDEHDLDGIIIRNMFQMPVAYSFATTVDTSIIANIQTDGEFLMVTLIMEDAMAGRHQAHPVLHFIRRAGDTEYLAYNHKQELRFSMDHRKAMLSPIAISLVECAIRWMAYNHMQHNTLRMVTRSAELEPKPNAKLKPKMLLASLPHTQLHYGAPVDGTQPIADIFDDNVNRAMLELQALIADDVYPESTTEAIKPLTAFWESIRAKYDKDVNHVKLRKHKPETLTL